MKVAVFIRENLSSLGVAKVEVVKAFKDHNQLVRLNGIRLRRHSIRVVRGIYLVGIATKEIRRGLIGRLYEHVIQARVIVRVLSLDINVFDTGLSSH